MFKINVKTLISVMFFLLAFTIGKISIGVLSNSSTYAVEFENMINNQRIVALFIVVAVIGVLSAIKPQTKAAKIIMAMVDIAVVATPLYMWYTTR